MRRNLGYPILFLAVALLLMVGVGEVRKYRSSEAYRQGIAAEKAGKLDKALAHFERAIKLKPGFAEAYGDRGGSLLDTRRLGQCLG